MTTASSPANALLTGINRAIGQLMEEEGGRPSMLTSLRLLTEAVRCEAASFLEVFQLNDEGLYQIGADHLLMKKEGKWEVYTPGIDRVISANDPRRSWLKQIAKNEWITGYGHELPEPWQIEMDRLDMPIKTYLMVPLVFRDEVLGILLLAFLDRAEFWDDMEKIALSTYTTCLSNIVLRGRREQEAAGQRDFLRKIIDLNPNIIYAKDQHERYILVNQKTASILGLSPEEAVGKTYAELRPDSPNGDHIHRQDLNVLQQGHSLDIPEETITDVEGRIYRARTLKTPIRTASGEIEGLLGVSVDLTERLETEEWLAAERKFNASITATIPDTILLINHHDNRIEFTNRDTFLGYRFDDFEDSHALFRTLLTEDQLGVAFEQFYARLERLNDEEILEVEYHVRHHDGSIRWIRERTKIFQRTPNNKVARFLTVLQDISERKKVEQALRTSEMKLQTILSSTLIGTWEWDFLHNSINCSEASLRMLGYTPEEFVPSFDWFWDKLHPEDRFALGDIFFDSVAGADPYYEAEYRLLASDGTYRWIFSRGHIVERDASGMPLIITGMQLDIDRRKQSELKIKENETLLRSLFDRGPLGIFYIGPDWRIFRANPQVSTMLGRPLEDVIGANALDFTYPDDLTPSLQKIEQALESKSKDLQLQKRYVDGSGNIVWGRLYVTFVRGEDNHLQYAIVIAQDISQEQQAKLSLIDSERTLKASLQTIPDAKLRITPDGRILDAFLGENIPAIFAGAEQIIGSDLADFFPSFITAGLIHNSQRAVSTHDVQTFEFMLRNDGGQTHYYEARINQINPQELMLILRNVTDRKEIEQELKEKVWELDAKNRQLKEYISSNLQLENFAYIASHDLREPVRKIATFAERLQAECAGRLDARGEDYLARIVRNAERMTRLIESVLAVAHVGARPLNIERVDLAQLLDEVRQQAGSDSPHPCVRLDGSFPVIDGDRTQLNQLFFNLVQNGLKFGRPGVDAEVIIRSLPTVEGQCRIDVADNGVGVPERARGRIFQMFERLDRRDRDGVGIGLALCRRIVERHGGSIDIEPAAGIGTCFVITLPLRQSSRSTIPKDSDT